MKKMSLLDSRGLNVRKYIKTDTDYFVCICEIGYIVDTKVATLNCVVCVLYVDGQ